MKIQSLLLLIYIVFLFMMQSCTGERQADGQNKPSKVQLVKELNGYRLYVNEQAFYIKGAGFEGADPSSVALKGGNALRTWRPGDEFISGEELLSRAQEHGLMVCLGLDIARERHGFDYDDSIAVEKQFERIKAEVLRFKDHPALLAWGIGNELNLRYTNDNVWLAVNEIAEMIHQLDGNHPTTTMLAGVHPETVQKVMKMSPKLDFLSFQVYGEIAILPKLLQEAGYEAAYVVSEWGATGHWEVPKTAWGSPIEQNSHEKATAYKNRYEQVIAADYQNCIGSFVFLWGQKQERTPTWYGVFLEDGHNTESVDVMQYVWTGQWPENRSPQLISFLLNGSSAYDHICVAGNEVLLAEVHISDPDHDELHFVWEILPEVPQELQSDGGDFEPRPKTIWKTETSVPHADVTIPQLDGKYRLFVYAFDQYNNAATANIPFLVQTTAKITEKKL